ncbi:hypothetical protein N7494_013239 [Penicillium frequentans]|uniref:Uncharacterized protein n=1 Tax=Penicillium frequentans TaxID=3151616 RepID=A0AAD6G9I7_9EURO|nr:hypothetical protein N7494_013239 [Penicillium glabrum]
MTLLASNGTEPVAEKLFRMMEALKAPILASAISARKSSLSMELIPFRIEVETAAPSSRLKTNVMFGKGLENNIPYSLDAW